VCLGAQARAQNEAARRQYNAAVENRKRNWMQQLSVQNLKNVQYEVNMDRSGVAMAGVQHELQRRKIKERKDAELKYEQAYEEVMKNSKYEKLITGGATGRSIARLERLDNAAYGKKVALISRNVLLTDEELEMDADKRTSKLKGFREEQRAKMAFQPIAEAEPVRPVMQNVGAAMFMDALSIGTSVIPLLGD